MATPPTASPRAGFAFALSAYCAWGVFPIFFRALRHVSPPEILAHRVLWSAAFLAVLVSAARRWPELAAAFRSLRGLAVYLLSTSLVSCNWLLYIWAVTSGRVLEASLGYFINPLVNVVLGILFFKERLRPRQAVAVALAAAGVLVLAVRVGMFPWLALALALTFGGYGLVRKKAHIDPVVGLLIETSLLAPLGAGLIAVRCAQGTGWLGADVSTTALLLSTGVVTALPLIWFAHGVRSLPLSMMGLLQYLSPTLQFLCAVVLFHEPFTRTHAAAFACIWAGLVVYTSDALRVLRAPAVEPLD
jgi:chloramphenicol-sensitive protein RarD